MELSLASFPTYQLWSGMRLNDQGAYATHYLAHEPTGLIFVLSRNMFLKRKQLWSVQPFSACHYSGLCTTGSMVGAGRIMCFKCHILDPFFGPLETLYSLELAVAKKGASMQESGAEVALEAWSKRVKVGPLQAILWSEELKDVLQVFAGNHGVTFSSDISCTSLQDRPEPLGVS